MPEQIATRNTSQRNAVLESVRALGDTHPTSSEVLAEAKKLHPGISRATVYRNLDVLAEEGKILRVEMLQGPTRFDRTLTPHSHATCRICNKVFDIDIAELHDEMDKVIKAETDTFCIEGVRISFDGVCSKCMKEKLASR